MKYKHYAPNAEVYLLQGPLPAVADYLRQHAPKGAYALCFDGEADALPIPSLTYGHRETPSEQARQLFDRLRATDDLGASTVYVRAPEPSGLGLALYNRLLRAAQFRVIHLAAGTRKGKG